MSDQNTVEVVGKALYLEFIRTEGRSQTFQLLIHPDAATSAGVYVPFGVFHRTLSSVYPKRPWSKTRVDANLVKRETVPGAGKLLPVIDTGALMAASDHFQRHVQGIFSQLVRQGYTLYKQPIVVEVSTVDVDDMSSSATPYALLRRVMSARKTLGFPDALVRAVTPLTPTATI